MNVTGMLYGSHRLLAHVDVPPAKSSAREQVRARFRVSSIGISSSSSNRSPRVVSARRVGELLHADRVNGDHTLELIKRCIKDDTITR